MMFFDMIPINSFMILLCTRIPFDINVYLRFDNIFTCLNFKVQSEKISLGWINPLYRASPFTVFLNDFVQTKVLASFFFYNLSL